MKILRLLLSVCLILVCLPARSQVSTWAQGFDKSVNAASARAYLGISTNGTSGVSIFSADPLAGLFDVIVTTPTTTPHLAFSFQSQSPNLVFASPNGSSGPPSFRSLVAADLPPIPSGESVTNFAAGNASPLFTTSVATPTTWPTLSFNIPSQSQNLFYASPNGASGTPTFRSILSGDLPDLTSLIRGKVSGTAPVSYDSATGIFSMHVADASHDGYLSAADYTAFSSGTGGAGSSLDLSLTNDLPFSGGTNFYVDFGWQSHVFSATGSIVFNYSTNFPGSTSTSRVTSVFIPATNYLRHVYFTTAATNWHFNPSVVYNIPAMRGARFVFQAYSPSDNGVIVTPFINDTSDASLTNLLNISSLSVITSATNLLWVDANRGLFQDAFMTLPAQDGTQVYGWSDNSGQANNLTNFTTSFNGIYFRNAASAPLNVPCIAVLPTGIANTWLRSPAVTKLTQPVWVFMMIYGTKAPSGGASIFDSISGTTTRILCAPGFNDLCTIASANSTSFTITNKLFGQWELFAFKFNSTTSQIRTNGFTARTADAGVGVGNGFTVGSDIVNTAPSSAMYMAEIAVFWGNLSNADLGNIETNYFRVKYGAW